MAGVIAWIDGVADGCRGGRDADDEGCEWMRNATLSSATVRTMSRLKRIASIRKPAPRTDKLHHSDTAATKIIRVYVGSCRRAR